MSYADDLNAIAEGKLPEPTPKAKDTAPSGGATGAQDDPFGAKNAVVGTAKAGAEAFWGAMERNANAGEDTSLVYGGPSLSNPLALLRVAMKTQLPKEVVDNIFGASKDFFRGVSRKIIPDRLLPKEAESPEEFVKKYGKTPGEEGHEGQFTDRFVGEVPEGGAVTEHLLKPMARGVFGFAAQPFGGAGSVAKNVIMSAGAGEGGEIGSNIVGGLGKYVGGETGEKTGRVLGGLAGGAVGGQANIVRAKGTGAIAGKVASGAKAMNAALTPVEGDTRSFFTRLEDGFKHFEDTKARGYYDQIVAEKYAEAISKAPGAEKNLEAFKRMAGESGIDVSTLTPAQQTLAPALVEKERYFEPASREQIEGRANKTQKLHEAVAKVYEGSTGRKPGDKADINLSVNRLRQKVVTELDAREREAGKVMDQSTHTAPQATGSVVKNAFMEEKQAAQQHFNKLYSGAYRAADSAGVQVNVKASSAKALSDLTTVEAKALPKVGYELSHAVEAARSKQWKLSFKESHDLSKALRGEAQDAFQSGDTTKYKLLKTYRDNIMEDMQTATRGKAPYVWQQFEGINNAYRDKFVPRFSEGIAHNLDREAGAARKGLDHYLDEQVFSKGYLAKVDGKIAESNMAQFDATFGDKLGGQRNEGVYVALGKAVESDYIDHVYNGPKGREFDLNKHNRFMDDYKAALERTPALRAKLDGQAERIQMIKDKADLSARRWTSIVKNPLTETLGEGRSNQLIARALAEPRTMGKLVNRLGVEPLYDTVMARLSPMVEKGGVLEYDPVDMLKTLGAGAGPSGRDVGSIQMLMRAKWGKELGDKHFNNLKTIGSIALREMQTSPQFAGGESVVKPSFAAELTGQSAASWIALGRNLETGRAGLPWAITQAGGRFFRARISKGLQEAEYRAMFDPKYSEAVKDLAQTKMSERIKASTAQALDKAAGAGGKLFDDLVNRGFVRSTLARSAILGASQEADRQRDREAEDQARDAQRAQAGKAEQQKREAEERRKRMMPNPILGGKG